MVISIVKFRLRQAWTVLAPYVRAERALRNPGSMIFFEDLACRAEDFDDEKLRRTIAPSPLRRRRRAAVRLAPRPLGVIRPART
jgi:hypothetical protein